MKISLRDAACGAPCMIRLPNGVCNMDPRTSVLCHYRSVDIAGVAYKPTDLAAAIGCSGCHDFIDDRRRDPVVYAMMSDLEMAKYMLDGMRRTLDYWTTHGSISTNEFGELRWETR